MENELETKLHSLQRWVIRALSEAGCLEDNVNRRLHPRQNFEGSVTLVPLNRRTLEPILDDRLEARIKDFSDGGMAVEIAMRKFPSDLFFGESPTGEIYLLRKVRERALNEQQSELGLELLDRYNSYEALRRE